MTREIMITGADTTVEVIEDDGGDQLRVRLGEELYGVTLVGELAQLQRVVVEVDRQISALAVRHTGSPAPTTRPLRRRSRRNE